jgi:hypothetical protein
MLKLTVFLPTSTIEHTFYTHKELDIFLKGLYRDGVSVRSYKIETIADENCH